MMSRKIIMLVCLTLVITLIPTASADKSTNEAINSLTVSFTGTGNNTRITIDAELNKVAKTDGGLVIKFWIDEKDDANYLGSTTPAGLPWKTTWDINKWSEGYHVLIAELTNLGKEVRSDNKADNRLDLPFTTQEWFWAPVGEIYGYIQYTVTRLARQQAGGTFAFLADYPLWMWIILAIILILIIRWIIRHRRRFRRPVTIIRDSW